MLTKVIQVLGDTVVDVPGSRVPTSPKQVNKAKQIVQELQPESLTLCTLPSCSVQ